MAAAGARMTPCCAMHRDAWILPRYQPIIDHQIKMVTYYRHHKWEYYLWHFLKEKYFERNPGSNSRPLEHEDDTSRTELFGQVGFNRRNLKACLNEKNARVHLRIKDEAIIRDTSPRMTNLSAYGRFGRVYITRHKTCLTDSRRYMVMRNGHRLFYFREDQILQKKVHHGDRSGPIDI